MKIMPKIVLAMLLCLTVTVSGCSVAWVSTLDNILVAAAPALINILQIIAIAKGAPVNGTLSAKITADAAAIKTLATSFAGASALAAPGACSQLQAAITTYSSDEAQVLALAQVSDPATQQKVIVLSSLVAGTISGILAVIPNCSQAAAARATLARSNAVPLPLKGFIASYNAKLVEKTGNAAVDTYTAKHKVHVHSGVVRALSLGMAY